MTTKRKTIRMSKLSGEPVGPVVVNVRNPTVVPMLNRSGQGKHQPKRIKYKGGVDTQEKL